ncbi:MAG: DNA-protecting protein DprA [Candidatus Doudnabacteria bacterium]|nr:DNA-protecting protein DprA [Candidatus Doudnabacteria bacterium]
MPETKNKIYGNALNLIPELGAVKLTRLLNYFGDYKTAWEASAFELNQAQLDQKTIDAVKSKQPGINPGKAWEDLLIQKIEMVTILESEYPALLKEITTPPPLLYVRGDKKVLSKTGIAVVGSRKISQYGRQAIEEIVTALAQSRLNIISGLAFGVDAFSLHACLNAGAKPVAILASDLQDNSISPRSNFNLAQEVAEKGCLVSEYALNSNVQKQNFPIRNRLISGLSIGVLVIEADEESGALITANYALEQGREVFAIPGSIFSPTSRGTNKLIKQGAKLVSTAQDIFEELNLDVQVLTETEPLATTDQESQLLLNLTREPIHIDDLVKQVKLPVSEINATLSLLELKGRVKNLGGAKYVKIR